jgi:hypothetical protein
MSRGEGLTIQKQSRATLLKKIAYRKFCMPDSSPFSSSSKKPLTLALSRRERELIVVNGRGTPT